jgi:ABC-type sugar transport system substrate-binding protein
VEELSKFIRLSVAVVMAAGLTLATASAASPRTHASKGTIAFLLSGPDLYYQYGLKGAEAAAAKLGYTVKAYPNPNISPSVELANVRNALAAGSVAIDGYSVGLATEDASIAAAGKANVPIFLMYGYSHKYLQEKDVVGFEQVNLTQYSYPVGVYMRQHVKGQIAVITGQLGRGDAEGYRTGFLQGLGCKGNLVTGNPSMTCAGGKIQYVDTETGHWLRPDAYTAMQDIIGKYPDLSGVFVENEDMAVGAHTALVAAHKDKQVTVVSQNGAPYGLAGVKAGWLKATDTCSPALEGLMSVRLIDAYLNKKITGGHLYYSYSVFVTKANMSKAVGWTFFNSPKQVAQNMARPLPKPVANPA